MKIVIIGAGSECFGRGQIVDILQAPELQSHKLQLMLVDTDPTALDIMLRLAQRLKAHFASDISINGTTDRAKALPGADFVILAVARQRYPLWEQDFRVPLAYGFRHCLGENGGPGAVFHTMRSLELILPICRDIETYCPDALLLNFTNPEARVLHAICHLTSVRAAGICHGVFSVLQAIEQYTRRPIDDFDVISAGMNHFYCILQVREKSTGKEWLPELVEMVKHDLTAPPLFRKMAEVFDVFTFPSDDHIGEYLSYGAEYSGVKWHYGQECRQVLASSTAIEPGLEPYASGQLPLNEQILQPSGESTVPIITDILENRGRIHPAVNVLNSEGYIANLPLDAAIEVPARVDAAGLHPLHVGAIPETFAAMMRTQFSIHTLLTEAYRTRSKKLLLQALLLDPNVNSIEAAARMLDEMLELQREYLPDFAKGYAVPC